MSTIDDLRALAANTTDRPVCFLLLKAAEELEWIKSDVVSVTAERELLANALGKKKADEILLEHRSALANA